LTKKRATFGPRAYPPVQRFSPESLQLGEITVFFTRRDPASAQVCHDRPRTPAAPIGREYLNSLRFSPSALAGARDQLDATTTAGENSRSLHKFQANNGRRRARVALNSS
jgi:hypothetical protein